MGPPPPTQYLAKVVQNICLILNSNTQSQRKCSQRGKISPEFVKFFGEQSKMRFHHSNPENKDF